MLPSEKNGEAVVCEATCGLHLSGLVGAFVVCGGDGVRALQKVPIGRSLCYGAFLSMDVKNPH